jgi:bifunctional non-homologous end joining protein LigD
MRARNSASVVSGSLRLDAMRRLKRSTQKKAILHGEFVVLDGSGKARFYGPRANRGTVVFAAFDLMWLNGRDMRDLPLLEREEILRFRLRFPSSRVIFVDHILGRSKALDQQICGMDREGIVCKPALGPYRTVGGTTTWIKEKNPCDVLSM